MATVLPVSQAILFIAIYAVGLSVLLAFGPRRHLALICALSFPLGIAILVPTFAFILALEIPYNLASISTAMVLMVALGGWQIWRTRAISLKAWQRVAIYSALFSIIALGLCSFNMSILSYDSHRMLMLGKGIGAAHGIDARTWAEFNEWSAFLIILHSTTEFVGLDYFYSLTPVFAASFLTFFALALHMALVKLGCRKGQALLLVSLALLVLSTTYLFSYHLLYIHTNLLSAVFLFSFVALWWFAETESDLSYLAPALLFLFAFSLVRMEAPIIASIFLALTLMPSRLPRQRPLAWLLIWAVGLIGWYAVLLRHAPANSEFLSPSRLKVLIAGVAMTYAVCFATRWSRLRRLAEFLPLVIVVIVGIGLAGTFLSKPDHMQTSTLNLLKSLTDFKFWSGFWYATILLGLLALWMPKLPFGNAIVYGVPVYLAVIVMLGYLRAPYRFSYTDSANRMALHVAPLLVFYFALKFFPQAFSQKAPSTTD